MAGPSSYHFSMVASGVRGPAQNHSETGKPDLLTSSWTALSISARKTALTSNGDMTVKPLSVAMPVEPGVRMDRLAVAVILRVLAADLAGLHGRTAAIRPCWSASGLSARYPTAAS